MINQVNLTKLFNNTLSNNIHKPIIGFKHQKKWTWKTRADLKVNVLNCIDVLKDRKVSLYDRVMYKGDNSFEWISWNIATNALGAIWVPLYENQGDNYVNHIIKDCYPKLFITNGTYNNVDCIDNSILNSNFNNNVEQDLPIHYHAHIAKLIYTSGTTGDPKGVMLTHNNIIANYEAIDKRFHNFKYMQLTSLNILPWAHIYGLTAELYYNIFNRNKVAISSGKDEFINEIREIKPNILYLVPRILDLIKSKVQMFDKPILNIVLPKLLHYIFGGNITTIFIGGAQLSRETRHFFVQNDISICEGYGCTETSPMISVNHTNLPNRNINSIGKIMDNLIVEIVNNEILVSGPSVMPGYWNNDEVTNNSLIKIGNKTFYKTGDEGYVRDGFLFYTGRISENYKLNNGKFVSLLNVENIVKSYLNFSFIVYGDNRPHNIIITEKGNNISDDMITKINSDLDNYLHIKDVLYLDEGTFAKFMTPKLSLKRKALINIHMDDIDKIYN